MPRTVTEPERQTPVWKDSDVLVVGGGVAGIVAAVAAARSGARTVLIEQSGVLGNMAAGSVGLPILAFFSTSGKRLTGGIPEEIVTRMMALGGCAGHTMESGQKYSSGSITVFDPEVFSRVVHQLLNESGVDVYLHTWFAAPWMDGHTVKGVFVETKSGRLAISARVTVDCSGDGDVAFRAGAPTAKPGGDSGEIQPATLPFVIDGVDVLRFAEAVRTNPELYRVHQKIGIVDGARGPQVQYSSREISGLEPLMVPLHAADKLGFPQPFMILCRTMREGQFFVNMAKVVDVDVTDVDSYSRGEMLARMRVAPVMDFLRQYVPGFEHIRVVSTPHQLGIREGRLLLGEHILTIDEMAARQTYPDTVAMGGRYVDIHRVEEKVDFAKRKVPVAQTFPDGYFIPYRCLVPRQVDGLLVAGRCSSATRAAMGSVRVMGCVMALGQAAGVAAALSAKSGAAPRDVNMAAAQDTLRRLGGIVE